MRSLFTAIGVSLLAFAAAAAVPPSYRVIDLGTLGGIDAEPWCINTAGQVVGSSQTLDGYTRAFLWSNGMMIDLGDLGGHLSWAGTINDRGDVVGVSYLADRVTSVAFLYHDGVMAPLPGLETTFSDAAGINNNGDICGTYMTQDGNWHPYILREGTFTDFAPAADSYVISVAINSSDWVAGTFASSDAGNMHAFLWRDGVLTDLGTLGGPYSYSRAINDAGQIAGTCYIDGGNYHPVVFSDGSIQDLGTLGGCCGDAFGINNFGDVVGEALTADDYYYHGFLYTDGVMHDLNHYLRCADLDWRIEWINSINDAGQMVGIAHRRSDESTHAVLLTPSSESTDPLPGDLNLDGVVSLNDVAILLSNYGIEFGATREQGDMDGDGDVDLADISAILSQYGATCPQ